MAIVHATKIIFYVKQHSFLGIIKSAEQPQLHCTVSFYAKPNGYLVIIKSIGTTSTIGNDRYTFYLIYFQF